MSISFEDGNLVITLEQEIPIFVPEADFSLPKPPAIPSFDFPEVPDAAKMAIKLKKDIEAQLSLQGQEPDISLSVSSGNGSGGGGVDLSTSFEKPKFDISSYLGKMDLKIPTPNLIPSFDFPEPPDVAAQALKIKADLEAQLALSKSESQIELDVSSGNGSGGGGFDFSYKQPDISIDIESKLKSLSPELPVILPIPSFDFPDVPDFSKFGEIPADIDGIKSELNAPGIPGVNYNPGGAIMKADVYLKSRISRVKII
jgi:hypothetical protein